MLPLLVPISTFPLAPLLNHEMWNINDLIILAESEIKGFPFYCFFLADGGLILHNRRINKKEFGSPGAES